jgi:tetratricopeptide (TPR) repeat protein
LDSVAAAFRAAGARLAANDQARIDIGLATCPSDHRAEYAAAQQLFRSAPEVAEYVLLISWAALNNARPREAVSCLERMERTRDPDPPHSNIRQLCLNIMMHAYHQLGQYREALELVDHIRADSTDNPLLERYEMRQWAALGDTARINRLLDQRLRKSNKEWSAGGDMTWIGEELGVHGHLAAGRALCERALVWYATRPPSEQRNSATDRSSPRNRPLFGFQVNVARASFCAERWDQARVAYTRLFDDDSTGADGIGFRTRLGALAARRDDTAEVTRIDQWLAARDSLPVAAYGRAVLAGFRGDRERALAFFQFAWEREDHWQFFASAEVDPALEPLRDYPPFRALLYATR